MVDCTLAHITWTIADNRDRESCDNFISEVFGAQTAFEVLVSMDNDAAEVDREESLLVIADAMLIPVAPAGQGLHETSVIGNILRLSAKPGMWVGMALEVEDLEAAEAWVRSRGFTTNVGGEGGVYFLVSGDQTLGLPLEFLKVNSLPCDPRRASDFDINWWRNDHPLGIERIQSIGVSVDALDQARELYAGRFGWRELSTRHEPVDEAECAAFWIGNAVIEAMQPNRPDSALAHHRRDMQGIYCITFKVRSAAQAGAHLRELGFKLVGDDRRFAIDPAQAYGRLIYFTDELIENDPRAAH
jgi:hypothetical protein